MIHDCAEHANRQSTLLVGMDQANQLHERPSYSPRDHLKRHQFADGHLFAEHQICAVPNDNHCQQFFQQFGNRGGRDGNLANFKLHGHGLSGALIPVFPLDRFHAQRLDRLDSVNRFDQHRLAFTFRVVQRFQSPTVGSQQHTDVDSQHG